MAGKRGRPVTAAERPIYDQCHQLMLEGRIFFWSVPAKNEWIIWLNEEDFGTLDQRRAGTDGGYRGSFADAKAWLMREGLLPQAEAPKARSSVTQMRSLLHRLAGAVEAGTVDTDLLAEAKAA